MIHRIISIFFTVDKRKFTTFSQTSTGKMTFHIFRCTREFFSWQSMLQDEHSFYLQTSLLLSMILFTFCMILSSWVQLIRPTVGKDDALHFFLESFDVSRYPLFSFRRRRWCNRCYSHNTNNGREGRGSRAGRALFYFSWCTDANQRSPEINGSVVDLWTNAVRILAIIFERLKVFCYPI